jgi:hypothetical protein
MGGLSTKNRDNNLILLQRLLKEIVRKWPDVRFVTSNQLSAIIIADRNFL